MGEAIGKTTKQFASLNPVFGVFAGAAAGIGAAALAASGSLVAMAVETAEVNDKLFHQSEIAGTSFETFQRLAAGAKMYEISSESLSMSLTRMSRQALQAAVSVNYAATPFGRLGIQVKDASGHLKDSGDLFTEIMDKLSGMSNVTERNALAMQLMGRSAIQLIPALSAGSAKFKEYGDFAERVEAVLSTEAGEGAHQFSVAMKEVELITEGAKNRLTEGIIPALTQLIDAYANASHGGELFTEVGKGVGEGLKFLSAQFANLVYGSRELGLQWQELTAIFNFKTPISISGFKVARAQLQGELQDLDAQIKKNRQDYQQYIDDLNKPPEVAKKAESSGAGADLRVKDRTAGKVEKDTLQDFVDKTNLAVAEQLKLAAAIGQTASAETLVKADADAEKAIAEKRLEIEGKLSDLKKSKGQLIAAGEVDQADKLNKDIANLEKQMKELPAVSVQITAAFESTAVLTSLNEIGKSVTKTTQDVADQVAEQERLNDIQSRGAAGDTFLKADEKVRQLSDSLEKQREEYRLLAQDSAVKPQVLEVVKNGIDSLALQLSRLKTQFETVATLEAFNKVNDDVKKTTQSIAEQLGEQEALAKLQSSDTASEMFAKADEKAKDLTKALKDARAEYQLLAKNPGADFEELNQARDSAEQLAKKLQDVKVGFEAIAVLSSLNEMSASIAKTTKGVAEEVSEQQKLAAARLQGAAAYSSAQVDEKIKSEVVELQNAQEEYQKLASAQGASFDATAVEAAKQKVDDLQKSVAKLRAEYKQLATTDPAYWQKIQQDVAADQIQFGSFQQAIIGFATELKLQGQNIQKGFFDTLKQGVDGFEQSLAKFIVTGKGGFTAVLQSMEEGLIKLALQFVIAKGEQLAFQALGLSAQGAGIGASQVARQSAIGQAAAESATSVAWLGPEAAIAAAALTIGGLEAVTALEFGGPVTAGNAYIVGEKRPELFVPSASGRVIPSVPTGGGGGHTVNVHTSLSVIDASGFSDLLEKHANVVARHVDTSLRKSNLRI